MDRIPQKGSRASRDLKSLLEDAPYLPIDEITEKVGLSVSPDIEIGNLREVIIPSEDGRPRQEWTEKDGLAIPAKSQQFTQWPMTVDEDNFYLCLHARNWNRTEEFWSTIRKEDSKNICWFELVKTSCLPWFAINVIPEKEISSEDYDYMAQFTKDNIPKTLKNIIDPIPADQIMMEYTFSVNSIAFTVVDLGMVLPLSEFFYERLQNIKALQLTPLLKSAVDAFRKDILLDYDNFRPRTA